MAKIKKSFFKKYNYFISFLISLLGIQSALTGCNEYGTMPAEYGVPATIYEVDGSIVDNETNKAIEGIVVTMNYEQNKTDSLGSYHVQTHDYSNENSYSISYEDMDEEQNGLYENKDTLIEFNSSDIKGSDDYYWYKKTINISLKKKTE